MDPECANGKEIEVIQLLMEEYRTFREEIISKLSSQANLLGYGAGGIALLRASLAMSEKSSPSFPYWPSWDSFTIREMSRALSWQLVTSHYLYYAAASKSDLRLSGVTFA